MTASLAHHEFAQHKLEFEFEYLPDMGGDV
jgi:hypothetical protein